MNKDYEKQKAQIGYCQKIMDACWESIREIQKICDHQWGPSEHKNLREQQECLECGKTRWRPSCYFHIHPSTEKCESLLSSYITTSLPDKDGWYS